MVANVERSAQRRRARGRNQNHSLTGRGERPAAHFFCAARSRRACAGAPSCRRRGARPLIPCEPPARVLSARGARRNTTGGAHGGPQVLGKNRQRRLARAPERIGRARHRPFDRRLHRTRPQRRIWDVEGKRYVDFAGGIAVVNTGHCHPKVMAAVREQMERFTHTCFQVTMYDSYVASRRAPERARSDLGRRRRRRCSPPAPRRPRTRSRSPAPRPGARRDRLHRRVPRPDDHGDDPDRQGRALQERLRARAAGDLPRSLSRPAARRHRRRVAEASRLPVQGRHRPGARRGDHHRAGAGRGRLPYGARTG